MISMGKWISRIVLWQI